VALLAGAVLLEVSASARLWGGQAALLRHLVHVDKPVEVQAYRQGDSSLSAFGRLFLPEQQPPPVDDLPLAALLAARPHLTTLARLGCSRWGQLRALPRAGVARRFGAALLEALDQAYGQRPDVYPWLTLPEVFEASLELPSQVESAPALLFAARRLLAQLQLWLQLRQLGVLAIELRWQMDARRNSAAEGALLLRSSQASADVSHLQRLLAERLGQQSLAAPVHALRLRSLETQARQGLSASLLPDEQLPGDSLVQLLERLSVRLGADQVLCLQARADHRPERMQDWRPALLAEPARAVAGKAGKSSYPADQPLAGWASALYPTWLLAEPLRLRVHQAQPYYQGPLTLLAGPQRLESGWWPALPLALRDYFVARSAQSQLLWIYRERLAQADLLGGCEPGWYLHGVFA
jgi:protein ImuB